MRVRRKIDIQVQRLGKSVGRADLLYWLARTGAKEDSLERVAELVGYEAEPTEVEPREQRVVVDSGHSLRAEPAAGTVPRPRARWFHLTERQVTEAISALEDTGQGPLSIRGVPDFAPRDLAPLSSQPLGALEPLAHWHRLWPVMKQRLSEPRLAAIDIGEVVRRVASGALLQRLPRQRRSQWASDLLILLDFNPRVLPFWDDFHALCEELLLLRGHIGARVLKIKDQPGGECQAWSPPSGVSEMSPALAIETVPWVLPRAGTTVLILSDLGMLAPPEAAVRGLWARFGTQLQAAGISAVALAPVAALHLSADLTACFQIYLWSRASRLQPQRQLPPTEEAPQAQPAPVDARPQVRRLLNLLSPAIRVEPALLRELRGLLPAVEYDAGCEAEVWLHPDVVTCPTSLALNPKRAEQYQQAFRSEEHALQLAVLRLIRRHHAHLFPAIVHEETLLWASLAAEPLQAEFKSEIDAARRFLSQYARMLYRERSGTEENKLAYGERLMHRSTIALREHEPALSVVYGVTQLETLGKGGALSMLPGLDRVEVERTVATGPVAPRTAVLMQRGESLVLDAAGAAGSPYAEVVLSGALLKVQQHYQEQSNADADSLVDVTQLPRVLARLTQDTLKVSLESGTERLTILPVPQRDRLPTLGRDSRGLYVEYPWCGELRRLYWQPPAGAGLGAWANTPDAGIDAFGLYATLTLDNIVQRFRWIAPGEFLMGSPETEPERGADEVQHEVTLTKGYWLAETACTQALWQVLMGENPSRFIESSANPVEQVSWNDVRTFLEKLNARLPRLGARLPSEAEWEYACRAGTTTPFSFGENITPEQVNYDGNYPYAGSAQGLDREKTVPVGSLPANPWGFYEMHGNVWEWCQDRYGDYPSSPVTDPTGPKTGGDRVLRGGSWLSDGGYVRSACRSRLAPVYRDYNIGFRLALGQVEPEIAERGTEPGRTVAAERDGQVGRRPQ